MRFFLLPPAGGGWEGAFFLLPPLRGRSGWGPHNILRKMKLELIRSYFPNGTNGEIFLEGKRLCYSIELPWHDNHKQISCVPEGTYELVKRYSPKFGHHLLLLNVPDRDFILVHPANDALKELKGCIAPVSLLTAEGKGSQSRLALEKLKSLTYPELENDKQVFLRIMSADSSFLSRYYHL
jgi:hypothetical protein